MLIRLGGKPWFQLLAERENVDRTQRCMGFSKRLACHYSPAIRRDE